MKTSYPACCSCGTPLRYRRDYTLKWEEPCGGGKLTIIKHFCLKCYPKAKRELEEAQESPT